MKKLIIVFIILFSITSIAQEKRTEKLDIFTGLKVYNGLQVAIVESDINAIEIIGSRNEDVKVKITNRTLKIFSTIDGIINQKDIELIVVFTASKLDFIDANEGAMILSKDTISQHNIEIRAQEGSIISLTLDVNYVSIKSVSGANIKLTGTAIDQDVELSTGAIYDAFDLETESTTLKASTGAVGSINTSNYLKAKATLRGKVFYLGNPTHLKKKTSLGGKIIAKK